MAIEFLIGIMAFLVGLSGFLIKDYKKLRLTFGIGSLLWALHFFLLSGFTAATIQVAMGLRTWISILLHHKKHLVYGYILISTFVFLLLMFFSWQGPMSILPTLAAINSTIAYTRSSLTMRLMFLISSLIWVLNAIVLGSIPGLIAEITAILFNLIGIWRLKKA